MFIVKGSVTVFFLGFEGMENSIDRFHGTGIHPYTALLFRTDIGVRIVVPGHSHPVSSKMGRHRVIGELHGTAKVLFREAYFFWWIFRTRVRGCIATSSHYHQQKAAG